MLQKPPSSLDGIKRLAKTIKSKRGVTHQKALSISAQIAGYEGYPHARRVLSDTSKHSAAGPAVSRPANPLRAFHVECRGQWVKAQEVINAGQLSSRSWTNLSDIQEVFATVLPSTKLHAHLPTGGGLDYVEVSCSQEQGCLEFHTGSGRWDVLRPGRLTLERIADSPAESFLFLELMDLAQSGAYEPVERSADDPWQGRQEELLEVGPLNYQPSWTPFSKGARTVVRLLNGKMLFVTKGSLWNGTPSTYDAIHDRMTARGIRSAIERALSNNRS